MGCLWLDFADCYQRALRCGGKEGSGSVFRAPTSLSRRKGAHTKGVSARALHFVPLAEEQSLTLGQ